MAPQIGIFEFWEAVGFFGGLTLFFKGFRVFREYRLLADTPEIPIRSIPMGLVHVRGQASGDESITSPVSHTACYFYKVEIEEWVVLRGNGNWHVRRTDTKGVNFYLEDGSGKVLVDAHEADYDLEPVCRREVGEGAVHSSTTGATDDELLHYLTVAPLKKMYDWVGNNLASAGHTTDPEKEQLRQSTAEAFQQPFLGGGFMVKLMAAQLPALRRKLEEEGPQNDPEKERQRQEGIAALSHPIGSPEFMDYFRRAMNTGDHPQVAQNFEAFAQAMQHPEQVSFESMIKPPAGRFRFTEYCIVPHREYHITGTCCENPHAKDAWDRNLIMKGQNEPTFFVSGKTEQGIESRLRRRAASYIFGGAALSVACLGIFLAKFGWLF